MTKKGFTLIEMLVAITIFSIVVSAISGIFISSVQNQKKVLANREVLDQLSYALEYMGRALRMAKKDLTGECVGVSGNNYGVPATSTISFLNHEGHCQQFSLLEGKIVEQRSSDRTASNFSDPIDLTSSNIQINVLEFLVQGKEQPPTDYRQPLVTIFVNAESSVFTSEIRIQTSISQRNIDIEI